MNRNLGLEPVLPVVAVAEPEYTIRVWQIEDGLPQNSVIPVAQTALKPSEDGKAWIIRLYGASGHDDTARLLWNRPVSVSYTEVAELAGPKAPEQIPVPAWSVVSLRAERP